jgi:hypothetical protein
LFWDGVEKRFDETGGDEVVGVKEKDEVDGVGSDF